MKIYSLCVNLDQPYSQTHFYLSFAYIHTHTHVYTYIRSNNGPPNNCLWMDVRWKWNSLCFHNFLFCSLACLRRWRMIFLAYFYFCRKMNLLCVHYTLLFLILLLNRKPTHTPDRLQHFCLLYTETRQIVCANIIIWQHTHAQLSLNCYLITKVVGCSASYMYRAYTIGIYIFKKILIYSNAFFFCCCLH